MKFLSFLNGYKTYTLALAGVVYAVLGYYLGNLDSRQALELAWAALTASALRHSVARASVG